MTASRVLAGIVMALLTARPVAADPGDAAPPPPAPPEHTSHEVAGAARPGEESGRLDPVDPGDSVARQLARGVLWVPRAAVLVVTSPIYGGAWAFDRLHLDSSAAGNAAHGHHRIGVEPTIIYETGFGGLVGLRASAALGEDHERVAVEGASGVLGGELNRFSTGVRLDTGSRLGTAVQLALTGNLERRPANPFYGLGNANVTAMPPAPIDPRVDEAAVAVTDRYEEATAALGAEVRPLSHLHAAARGAFTRLAYAPGDSGTPIGDAYDVAALPGFRSAVHQASGELELRWDTRHASSRWEDHARPTGALVAVSGARTHGLGGGADFWRYSAELQEALALARGPRVLVLRARAEGVSGSRADVPFSELPTLGGGETLRGYTFGRFRDRVAAVGSLQYEWDLSHYVAAYVFADAGRVYAAVGDLTTEGLRVGFGGGLALRDNHGALVDLSLASSRDGGLLFALAINPLRDARPRWR